MGVQGIDTQTQLSRPLLLSCRIRLPCVGKVYTRAQAEPGPTRLLPNHLGLPQTNEVGQCTPTGRYRPSTHQDDLMRRWCYLGELRLRGATDDGSPPLLPPILDEACTADDLATVTERAMACTRKWENIV